VSGAAYPSSQAPLSNATLCAFRGIVAATDFGNVTYDVAAPGTSPSAPFYETTLHGTCKNFVTSLSLSGTPSGVETSFSMFLGAFEYIEREQDADGGVTEAKAAWSQILNKASPSCQ